MTVLPTTPPVQLDDLLFSWQPGQPVLDIPALTVTPGEKVFLKGPSGSGKTTLLGLIGGVLVPERGHVSLLGTPINPLSPAARDRFRANHVGFIFQMFNLIPYLSVLENVLLPLGFSPVRRQKLAAAGQSGNEEAVRLLAQLGLSDPALLARPVTALSIGQQQRVAAARALIGRPEILIADEPTSALDSDTREAFIRLLFKECEAAGSTLLFVSHDAGLEHLFDRSLSLAGLNHAAVTEAAAMQEDAVCHC
ncbi:ABC transporter ATP-binding protein [Kistimonas asteriae]|uniref:ABC transporter ATP-binding protein n=1 Tax=Kistimonas asteriae TaxID=517724 RepID=UPI001BA7D650|nr:ABC transporter ATP-binding protein [Kistimonas asteriae]